jgi:hypothetical protein
LATLCTQGEDAAAILHLFYIRDEKQFFEDIFFTFEAGLDFLVFTNLPPFLLPVVTSEFFSRIVKKTAQN